MRLEAKQRFRMAEEVVDRILRPFGFIKKKTIWRRNIQEVLQQFSIVSTPIKENYKPYWGLNILSRCEDPAPLPWKLSVRWILEMSVKDLERRLEYLECFDFAVDMPPEVREQRVTDLLRKHVIPSFEMYTTEDSVKRMMGDRQSPFRAQSYVRLPHEWWPADQRAAMAKSSGKPGPRIIRHWKPPRDPPRET